MMMSRAEISVSGLVQGVGFRPFCYRLAASRGLKGFVRNMGDAGVQIIVEGEREKITDFLKSLESERPQMSRIDEIRTKWEPATGEFREFKVVRSGEAGLGFLSAIPPDMAICEECFSEMANPRDRRHRHPFITCVNCGPRFTIIEDLPYDRERTSMGDFQLCSDCSREYTSPRDRRYHAEPNCCQVCGPKIKLHYSNGEVLETRDPLRETTRLLDEGKIVVIKGIGGMHVATKTTEDGPLQRLREAFQRPQQPFAVMSTDLETVKTFAEVNEEEKKELTSPSRPIVVLKYLENRPLSQLVSPELDSVGVMLPYSGIQHLIIQDGQDPAYVMTSANLPGQPMVIENNDAISKLGELADYFLLHNRRIVNRCDDSVVKMTVGEPVFLRRSRGHVPMSLELNIRHDSTILALGADLGVTASILKNGRCFSTQHIGDVSKFETLEYLRHAVKHLMHLLKIKEVDAVACDLHPDYATSAEAESMARGFKAELVRVQHHHAHLVSLMAEHGLEEIVGIDADGIGYGTDGTLWGGEVMVASPSEFKRLGALASQPMAGGDLATQFPARMVAGILWGISTPGEVELVLREFCMSGFKHGDAELKAVLLQLERGVNVFQTSSCGRVLDATACLLGVCHERTYEGEPAIKLEAVARAGEAGAVKFRQEFKRENGLQRMDTSQLLADVLEALTSRTPRKNIAAGIQRALASGLATLAVDAARSQGMDVVGATGGVFYNDAMTKAVREAVLAEGLKFVRHRRVPPGDGGVSVGQALTAAHRLGK
jgi:hydrogenase maturation protein HypF